MKRYLTTIMFAVAILYATIVSASSFSNVSAADFSPAASAGLDGADKAQEQDSLAGMKIFQAASDYVFSARKLDVLITNIDKKGNPYYAKGYFVAVPDKGYMEIESVSRFQFSPKVVSSYNYHTNEYIIQPRKSTSSSISENPFSILSKSNKGIRVSDLKEGDVKGTVCTKISVTPVGKAYYQQADIYVSGTVAENLSKLSSSVQASSLAGLKVLRITVVIKKNMAFVVDIVKAGPSEPDKVGDYRLLISDHPGAEMVDLRD